MELNMIFQSMKIFKQVSSLGTYIKKLLIFNMELKIMNGAF